MFVNVSFEVASKPKHHRNFKYNKLFLQHILTLLADTYHVHTWACVPVCECGGGFEVLQYL